MGWLGDIGNFLTNRPGEQQQRAGLLGMGQNGQAGFDRLGGQLNDQAGYMQRIARGQESVSAEQLRQALQQNLGAQQSMAAGASPQNSAMAGLMASRNAMNLGSGLAGQQAQAGIQERQAGQNALNQMLLQQRGQEQANQQYGFGNVQPGSSWLDKFGGAVQAGASLYGLGHRGNSGQSQRPAPTPQAAPTLGGWGQSTSNRGFY